MRTFSSILRFHLLPIAFLRTERARRTSLLNAMMCSSDFQDLPSQMQVLQRSSRLLSLMASGVRYQRHSPKIAILP